jgi:hypothetical protein
MENNMLGFLLGFLLGFFTMLFIVINDPQTHNQIQIIDKIENEAILTKKGLKVECHKCKVSIGDTIYLMPKTN